MSVRTPADLVYFTIARLPLVLLAGFVAWVLVAGLIQLESLSFGTEFFVSNDATPNMLQPAGGATDEELLQAALDSGDPQVMADALNAYETRQEALATR